MSRKGGLAAILLVAGCATHDYTYARETRFDRPYLGGAAPVPEGPPSRPMPDWSVLEYVVAVPLAAVYVAAHIVRPSLSAPATFPGSADEFGPGR